MKTVVICGAGVDNSDGIDIPLAVELIPSIDNFLKKRTRGEPSIRLFGVRACYPILIIYLNMKK